jgi:hypothetical protein
MTIRAPILLGAGAALSLACRLRRARGRELRAGLVRAGVPKPLSACMAQRMTDRLNLKQLMRIRDLPRASNADSIDQFLHRVRALGDSEIVAVTTSSAALCATGFAR